MRTVPRPPSRPRPRGDRPPPSVPCRAYSVPCRVYIVPTAAAGGGARPPQRPPVPPPDRPAATPPPGDDGPTEDELRGRLRGTGLRATRVRLAVMKELAGAGVPLSHGEVVDRLAPNPTGETEGGPGAAPAAPRGFDQSTLFRGLSDLSDAGLVARLDLGDAVRRYEWLPADGAAPVHPHHVCTECGRVVCLDGFTMMLTPASGPAREQVGTIGEVVLRGRCGPCEAAAAE